ncbi:MAG: redoxin domain-containing protein [Gammaproteobacteria bacterium]|nr:redoxin domain-containing protein [Gammaproteobacteria bacterium]
MAKDNRWIARWMTALGLSLIALPALSQPQYMEDFVTGVPDGSGGMTSGPEVGERIPDFEALDQHGNPVSLSDVMGPGGAMVVFIRSADW